LNTLVNFRPAQPSKAGQFSTGVNTTNTTTSPTEQRVNQNMRVDCDGYRKQASLLNNQLPYYKTLQYFIQ